MVLSTYWTNEEDEALAISIETHKDSKGRCCQRVLEAIAEDMKTKGYPVRTVRAYQHRVREMHGQGKRGGDSRVDGKIITDPKPERVAKHQIQSKGKKKDVDGTMDHQVMVESEEGEVVKQEDKIRGVELLNENYRLLVEATTSLLGVKKEEVEEVA